MSQTEGGYELIEGLPQGAYSASYQPWIGSLSLPIDGAPRIQVEVRRDSVAELTLDLTDSGTVVVELAGAGELRLGGWVSIELVGAEFPLTGIRFRGSFASEPYLFGPLVPVAYSVRVVALEHADEFVHDEICVPVRAGCVMPVTIDVRGRRRRSLHHRNSARRP